MFLKYLSYVNLPYTNLVWHASLQIRSQVPLTCHKGSPLFEMSTVCFCSFPQKVDHHGMVLCQESLHLQVWLS